MKFTRQIHIANPNEGSMLHETIRSMFQGAMKASSVQTVTIPVTAQTAVLVMPLPGHVFAFMVTWDLRVVRPAPRVGMGTTVRIHVTVSMEGFVAERKGDVNVCRGFSGDCVKMVRVAIVLFHF